VTNPDLSHADQEQLLTQYTERAVAFIERNKDRPFFFYLAPNTPHVPLHVSDKFKGKSGAGLYGDVIMEIDWSVGQILEAIKKNQLDEDTLVIFSSDNGPWLSYGNHAGSAGRFREGKGTNFSKAATGSHASCAGWASPRQNSVCEEPLMTIDLYPTLARLIGAELPAHKIDGTRCLARSLERAQREEPARCLLIFTTIKTTCRRFARANGNCCLPTRPEQ
jgi:arylsulfatase A-like enzyme